MLKNYLGKLEIDYSINLIER